MPCAIFNFLIGHDNKTNGSVTGSTIDACRIDKRVECSQSSLQRGGRSIYGYKICNEIFQREFSNILLIYGFH